MSSVSVIVPCYNYGRFLPAAVGSLLDQPGVDVDVLIIDDASTDGSVEQAAELAAADARVNLLRHRQNRGHIATYNEGLEWADGTYTMLVSADDLVTPGALCRATAALDRHPSVGLIYGGAVPFRSGKPLPPARLPNGTGRVRICPGLAWLEQRCGLGNNPITTPEVMVRTRLQKELGGYRTSLPRTADREMWLRFAAVSDIAKLVDADQAYYRQHQTNMHNTARATPIDILEQRLGAFDEFFGNVGAAVPDAERLHGMARRSIARMALAEARREANAGRGGWTNALALTSWVADSGIDITAMREHQAVRWRLSAGPPVARIAGPVADFATGRRVRAWLRWKRQLRNV